MAKEKNKTSTLIDNIRLAAKRLKDCKLRRLNQIVPALKPISKELGFETDLECMVFIALFDRQCGSHNSDLEDISDYFAITSLDVMQFVPAINSLISRGFLTVENRNEKTILTRKQFMVCNDVFSAVIENRKVEPAKVQLNAEFDQFDFCQEVNNLKDQRNNGTIETSNLFWAVEKLENEHLDLAMVRELRSMVNDIESRTLFYEMCKDYSKRPDGSAETDINETLEEIYDRVLHRASVKSSILNATHPLMIADLIIQSDREEMKLTSKGIRLLFGELADSMIQSNIVEDRYQFARNVYLMVEELHRNPSLAEQRGLLSNFCRLENDNPSLSMITKVKEQLPDIKSRIIFYLIADELVDGSTYSISGISNLCSRSEEIRLKKRLKARDHQLMHKGLVEVSGSGMFDNAQLSLTEKGKELFLEEDLELFEVKVESKDLIHPDQIPQKRLFFDCELEHQLKMLRNSLSEENYNSLCQRLVENNLPKGVTVLLYGNPGTGKTESVMQIAKATARPIVHVDISATKTCWFGESEKLIKEVFTKYRKLCEKCKVKPILLFNEADAVFSKRKDSNMSSVAQTENAIQNIILEEMEKFDGILIATTNLADNLDKAFERRFLFKIRFDRPTLEARMSIWRDKLNTLTEEEIQLLASKFDLSGGEIDNITRKVIMTEVIEGTRPSIEQIICFCDQEKIVNKTNKVGF